MNTTLNKITTRAKQLRKKNPKLKYRDAIKKASIELRREHKIGGATKKSPVKKRVAAIKFIEKKETWRTPAKKIYRVERAKKGTFKGIKQISGIQNSSANRIRSDIERGIQMYNDNIIHLRKEKEKGYQGKINLVKAKLSILKKQLTEQNKLIRLMLK
jgi:hypothetical protein